MKVASSLLETAKKLWNISDELQFVRHVANYIYFAPKARVYFRLTESWHRSLEEVNSELDWMFYLQSKGIEFAHPIKSSEERYCEVVGSEGERYIVSVFKEARGERVTTKEGFSREFFENWGEMVGKMHLYTKNYQPKENVKKRFEWSEEEYHQNIVNRIRPEHGKIFNEFKRLEALFSSFPKDRDSYGLIHADLHTGNFNVDKQNQIMPFDFDDSVYSWFIYDIVVFLWALDFERFELNWRDVRDAVFKGYHKHNQLDPFWIERIPDFYNYRVILIHYYCLKALSDPKLDDTSREWMEKRVLESRDYFDLEKRCPIS